jgi:hypothetical protein
MLGRHARLTALGRFQKAAQSAELYSAKTIERPAVSFVTPLAEFF